MRHAISPAKRSIRHTPPARIWATSCRCGKPNSAPVLPPAILLDEIWRYARVEHTALDRDVAADPLEIFLQQSTCWRRGDVEMAVPVVAAHMRNEQLVTRLLLHRRCDVAYGRSHAAR